MAVLGYLLAALVMGGFAAVAAGTLTLGLIAGVVGGVLGFLCGFIALPTLAWGFAGLPVLALLGAIIGTLAGSLDDSGQRVIGATGLSLGVAVVWAVLVPMLTTMPLFHADAYRTLIGPVDTLRNQPDVAPVDPAHLRIVDEDLARLLAERVLGTKGALGSQVTVGRPDLQIVRGEWYWVAPLDHSGFFRWLANSDDGTPGYVMIAAVNPRDVRLVTDVGGHPIHLRYNMGAYFSQDPERHLYDDGYATKGVTDYSFEVDDDGHPYIVATEYEKRVGFGGAKPVGAILMNAETGAHEHCAIAACPAWVDLIQPESMVKDQVEDWGEYVHGWLNPSNKDRLKPTDDEHLARVHGADGHQYYYTGITSKSADKGTTGYMLVDARTGVARYYLQAGATEDAAMASAKGSVQEKRYTPVSPTPYNVDGAWSYLVPLKDSAGFVKAVGFVSVANDQVVAVGDTPEAALRKYREVLMAGGTTVGDAQESTRTLTGIVRRLGVDVKGGETSYYLWLAGTDSLAFVGTSAVSPKLALTRDGDRVELRYVDTGRGLVDIAAFDNLSLPWRHTAAERAASTRDSVAASRPVTQDSAHASAPHAP